MGQRVYIDPALGITNSVYPCVETSADSSAFRNSVYGLVFSTTAPSGVPRMASLRITAESLSSDIAFGESSAESNFFTGGTVSVRLLEISGQPCLAISDGITLSNALFSVWKLSPQSNTYRNYEEPVPTDLSDLPVPSFAPWRLKINGINDATLVSQASVYTSTENKDQIAFIVSGGSLVSAQKFLLIPDHSLDAPVPSGYTALRIDDTAIRWQDSGSPDVSAQALLAMASTPSNADKKARPGAVVLQSLDLMTEVGQGLNPESRIRQPLLEMGYSSVRDYKASTSKTLSEYIKGKQVWYSMSHGGTTDGSPYTAFQGLKFRDGVIRASNLGPLDLNYKLAIIDGCCSAQTVLTSEQNARNNNTLSPSCQAFADSFGPDSAYMGWSWTMMPNAAQTWSSEFINNLKFNELKGRGLTVAEAHEKFLNNHGVGKLYAAPASKNMKIYGSINNVIEQPLHE